MSFFYAKKQRFLIQILIYFLIGNFITLPAYGQFGSIRRSSGSMGNTNSGNDSSSVRNLNDLETLDQIKYGGAPSNVGLPDAFPNGMSFSQPIKIHVLGDVQEPGVFTAMVSDRAADILKSAKPNRSTVRIIQIRQNGQKTKSYDLYKYYYDGDLSQNPYLKDNDVIFVPKIKGAIRIEGPVTRPGIYELNYEKTLYDVVKLSGGFTGAISKSHPIKVIRYADGGQKFVLDVEQTKSSLKNFEIRKGDIYVIPDIINVGKNFDYTVESIPGENLVYPTSVPDVFVIGSVSQPGPYPYKSHLTIKDYLGFAGARPDAKLSHVKVLHDGKKKRRSLHAKVEAGDVIIVKEKNMTNFLKYLGVASTVLSLTLSAVVLRDSLNN